MTPPSIQIQLFQNIKNKLPPQSAFVEEIAGLLQISTDSAYRRIKGEKPLSMEEVYKLCLHYKISLDNLLGLQSGGFQFTGNFVDAETFRFDQWLTNALQNVKYMTGFRERTMYYLCKDLPLFDHFHFREVAA